MTLLAFQFGLQPILSKKYTPTNINKSSVIFMQEIIKFIIALCMLLLNGQLKSAIKGWTIQSWIKVALIPALLYSIQNMSALIAVQNLDPLTFNVLNQTKTLSAAFCCYLIMGRKQSWAQVFSLCLLLCSALIIEKIITLDMMLGSGTMNWNISTHMFQGLNLEMSRHVTHGVAPVLLASFISGLAGALSQKILQSSGGRNALFFSMELCVASIIFLSINMYKSSLTNESNIGIGEGWTITTFIPIITNAIGGLLVGLVTKYAGSVRKGFALIFGIFISGLVVQLSNSSEAGGGISNEQIIGGLFAAFSLWLHSSFPYKENNVGGKGDTMNGGVSRKIVGNGALEKKKKKKSMKED